MAAGEAEAPRGKSLRSDLRETCPHLHACTRGRLSVCVRVRLRAPVCVRPAPRARLRARWGRSGVRRDAGSIVTPMFSEHGIDSEPVR